MSLAWGGGQLSLKWFTFRASSSFYTWFLAHGVGARVGHNRHAHKSGGEGEGKLYYQTSVFQSLVKFTQPCEDSGCFSFPAEVSQVLARWKERSTWVNSCPHSRCTSPGRVHCPHLLPPKGGLPRGEDRAAVSLHRLAWPWGAWLSHSIATVCEEGDFLQSSQCWSHGGTLQVSATCYISSISLSFTR